MVMASCVAVLFGDKIRSQSKPFLYLFQLVAAKDPVHDRLFKLSITSVARRPVVEKANLQDANCRINGVQITTLRCAPSMSSGKTL